MFNISGDTFTIGIDNSDGDKFKISAGALGTNDRMEIDSSGNSTFLGNVKINTENAEAILTISRDGNDLVSGQGVGSIVFPADYGGTPTNYGKIVTYANALSSLRGSIDLKVKSTAGSLLTGLTVYGTSSGVNVGIGIDNPSVKLGIKSAQDSSFDEGIGVIRSNSSQTGYINMVGGAMNINAPSGIPIKFRDGGVENVVINAYGSVVKTVSGVSKGSTQYTTSSTSTYTDILTFDTITNNRSYSLLVSSSENNFCQMYRVSGSVAQNTCLKFELGDSGHAHSKDVEFRITDVSGVRTLQVKAIAHTTQKVINVFDVCVALGDVTFA